MKDRTHRPAVLGIHPSERVLRRSATLGLSGIILLSAGLSACNGDGTSKGELRLHAKMMPLGAGTLGVSPSGSHAVAVYPERGAAFVTQLDSSSSSKVDLGSTSLGHVLVSDERAFVLDLAKSEVAVVDLDSSSAEKSWDVCSVPRGMVLSSDGESAHVACASGELWTLDVRDGSVIRKLTLEPDLRDVALFEDGLAVTKFRSAEVLILDSEGEITNRFRPPHSETLGEPGVAWRMATQNDDIYLLYQYASEAPLGAGPGGYYGNGCSFQVVLPAVSIFEKAGGTELEDGEKGQTPLAMQYSDDGFWLESTVYLQGAAGAVDMTLLPDGQGVVVTAPGNAWAPTPRTSVVQIDELRTTYETTNSEFCNSPPLGSGSSSGSSSNPNDPNVSDDAFVGIAASSRGVLVSQLAGRAELKLGSGDEAVSVSMDDSEASNKGHRMFHMSTNLGIACVSCHPDGSEDGHTWNFSAFGLRRTQPLRGGVSMRSAFHWDGSLANFEALMSEVFVGRMGMTRLPSQLEQDGLMTYLDSLPAPIPAHGTESELVEQGRELFYDNEVACGSCHSGSRLTDGNLYDVGTGGEFITPSLLGIATRAPYMHDGCAKDLHARFGACGGRDSHGVTSHLSDEQVDALVAFLMVQ